MKIHTEVNYRTHAGNPATYQHVVEDTDLTEALRATIARVRRFKRCAKIDGGTAVPIKENK